MSYWSVQDCCWVASPGRPDALATPWSDVELPVPAAVPAPRHGYDVLGLPLPVPGQRADAPAADVPEPVRR